jgi:hypothetical protein
LFRRLAVKTNRLIVAGTVLFLVGCSWAIQNERAYHIDKAYVAAVDIYSTADAILKTDDIVVAHALADGVKEDVSDVKFRTKLISADLGEPKLKLKEIERGSEDDQTHQVAYLGMIVERKTNKELQKEIPGKIAKKIAGGIVNVGSAIVTRLPWYMRYGIYFIAIGAVITGVLMVAAWLWIRGRNSFRILAQALEDQKGELDTEKLRKATEGTSAQKEYYKLRDKGKLWHR